MESTARVTHARHVEPFRSDLRNRYRELEANVARDRARRARRGLVLYLVILAIGGPIVLAVIAFAVAHLAPAAPRF